MAPAEKTRKAPKRAKVSQEARPAVAPVAAAIWPESSHPSLMFLPDKIRGARSRRRANQKAALIAAGLLALAAVGYISVAAGTSGAQSDLEAANEITAGHNRFLEENSAFQNYYDGFIKQKSEVADILANDMAYSKVVKALLDANSVGADFSSINSVEGRESCPSPDLFSPSLAVGCLDVSGTVENMADVGSLAASLEASGEFLVDPYVTESTAGDNETSFRFSVGYTDKAFSFVGEKFRPTAEELASITQAPAPAAPIVEEAAQ